MTKNPLTIKPMKRYEDCNLLVKLWRCRWYLRVPPWTLKEWWHERKLHKTTDHHIKAPFGELWSLMVALAEYNMYKGC